MTTTTIKTVSLTLFAVAVALLLFGQTFHSAWQPHLQTDIVIHHQQANQYSQSGSWRDITFKEYQPGALWIFLVPHALSLFQDNYNVYLNGTLFLNALLLAAHGWLFYRHGPSGALWIFLLITAAAGPILLYRFELIVSLLALTAWVLFRKDKPAWSAWLLGIATATKLYPAVIFPVVIAEYIRRREFITVLMVTAAFFLGLVTIVLPFLIFGGTIADISESFTTYSIKPISLDSFWGSLLTIREQMRGTLPNIDGANGIQGIAESSALLPLSFYNFFWLFSLGITFLILLSRFRQTNYAHPLIPIILLTVFTLSAKVINPQYIWWFFSFVPLLALQRRRSWLLGAVLVTTLLSLTLTQIVYPINYTAFLDWFYGRSTDNNLFIVSVVRNILLATFLSLLALATYEITTARPRHST